MSKRKKKQQKDEKESYRFDAGCVVCGKVHRAHTFDGIVVLCDCGGALTWNDHLTMRSFSGDSIPDISKRKPW